MLTSMQLLTGFWLARTSTPAPVVEPEVVEETPKKTSRRASRGAKTPVPVVEPEVVEAAPEAVVEPEVVEETPKKTSRRASIQRCQNTSACCGT